MVSVNEATQNANAQDGPKVSELTPGQVFTGRYACARKDRMTSKNGSAYLNLELRDRTGSIPARIFREVDQIGQRFEQGDAIRVRGKVERFRGILSAELENVEKLEGPGVDPTEFIPVAYRDPEELEGFLEHLTREVHDPVLRQVVERAIFTGPSAEEFRRAPCTRNGHHAYLGGLMEHTVAVGTLVTETCVLHPKLNSDLLMAAALLHDIGKTGEFTYGAEIGLSERGQLLGHLQIGAEIITAASQGVDEERRTALLSCVMCHHGTEALRLRRFPSAEAIALYRLNALDAGVKTALEHGIH